MEHAIRHHLREHWDEDPGHYSSLSERLEEIIEEFGEQWEQLTLALGDLLEGVVLHAFEGKAPFPEEALARIAELKSVHGLGLGASGNRLRSSWSLRVRAGSGDQSRTARRRAGSVLGLAVQQRRKEEQ